MKYAERIIIVNLSAIIIALVMESCARQGSPTGGPRDSIPPLLEYAYPELETTNFHDTEIEIVFNEYIQARTFKKDVIINPPIEDYDYRTNKRTLTIQLNEKLKDSTTYTINFGEAIKDATEGNSAENVVIAFSTGPTIDSFAVQGNVKQLMTQLPAEDIIVALYNSEDTLDIFNSVPLYLAKTNEEGNYEIRYIKEGSYRIYAFKDESNNLKAESDKEPYGFKAEPIRFGKYQESLQRGDSLITLYQNVDINIQGADIRPIEVLSSRPNGKYYEVRFNKYITQYDLEIEENFETISFQDSLPENINQYYPNSIYSNFQDDHKLVRIYNNLNQDSVLAIISAVDSIQQLTTDTMYLKFAETQRRSEQFTQTINIEPATENYSIGASIKFSKPIIGVNMDSVIFKYDTLVKVALVPEQDFTWNKYMDELIIQKKINKDTLKQIVTKRYQVLDSINAQNKIAYELSLLDSVKAANTLEDKLRLARDLNNSVNDPKKRKVLDSLVTLEDETQQLNLLTELYDTATVGTIIVVDEREIALEKGFQLNIGKGGFISVEMDSSKQMKQSFQYMNPENYGTVRGNITTEYPLFTVQLINEQYEVVREISNQKSYMFDFIEPGTYYIRVLIDENENGRWDKGNILELAEPEPVLFYEKEITLRENWEVDGENLSF